ncbi:hypothetical protein ACGF3G_00780 [Streptomyces sp. NPDC048179]|uniref:hypothetical protein n=1 Tax=Streptomyces sp. NPDC048179 TaxID=3365506 RepID=UPI003717FB75
MPASAHQPDSQDEHMQLAPVVSLADHRDTKPVDSLAGASDEQLATEAARHWAGVFEAAGIELGDKATAATVAVVTKEFERLVSGLLVLREGQGHLPPNPEAGVDFTSAVQMTGMFRDLAHAAAEAVKAKH